MKKIFAFALALLCSSNFGFVPLVISIPKSGTHMVVRLAHMMTGKKEHWMPPSFYGNISSKLFLDSFIYFGHCLPSKEIVSVFSQNRFRAILVIRDPRDQILSFIDWIYKKKAAPLCFLPYDQLFKALVVNPQIRPGKTFESSNFEASWEQRYRSFLQWSDQSNTCLIHYEDLVGPRGGGSLQSQIESIKKIGFHLGMNLSEDKCKQLAERMFGGTLTFNKARIYRWKSEFTSDMQEFFQEWFSSEFITKLGYHPF